MKRGRPTKSIIRQNVVEILHILGKGYGYEIAKAYNQIFPQVTQRSIYYHLRKGTKTNELEVHQIKQEQGQFSWGPNVEKTYYKLGPLAQPKGDQRVTHFLKQWRR